jgi:arsenate reductase
MAQGFLQSFGERNEVFSAGTFPASKVNANAIKVMSEVGIDISMNIPRNVSQYLHEDWDYVITVCDDANEMCPYFPGKVKHRLHFGFQDPSNAIGSEEFIISEFRRIRDEIKHTFYKFYNDILI